MRRCFAVYWILFILLVLAWLSWRAFTLWVLTPEVLHPHCPPWCHGLDHIPLFLSACPVWALPLGAEALGIRTRHWLPKYKRFMENMHQLELIAKASQQWWTVCKWTALGESIYRVPWGSSTDVHSGSTWACFFELWLDDALREVSPALGNGLPFLFIWQKKKKRLSISNISNVECFLFLRRNMIWGRKVGWVVTPPINFYVVLMLLCTTPHSSEVQVTDVACSPSLSETREQTSLSMPSPAKRGHSRFISCPPKKISANVSISCLAAYQRQGLRWIMVQRSATSFSKARAVMQDSTSLEESRSRRSFSGQPITDLSGGIEAQLLPEVMS